MRRLVCTVLFALFYGAAWAEHPLYSDATDYSNVTIDLTRKVDLKMLYDGGLRPVPTPGLEAISCGTEDVRAKIIFPKNRVVTMLVMRATFHVDAEGNLTSFSLEGPAQSIDLAVAQARRICDVLSLNRS